MSSQKGIIIKRTKGFYYLENEDGAEVECKIKGSLFQDSRFDSQAAVGDRVKFTRSKSDSVGLIHEIEPRTSFLARSRVGIGANHVIAANMDFLLMVASAKKPSFRPNLIFRLLVAASIGKITPVLVISKTDLIKEDLLWELIKPFEGFGLQIITFSINRNLNRDKLKAILTDHISALCGQSGVGKSSLLNVLFPGLNIRIGEVTKKNHKGSHTTTNAFMHKIAKNSYVIDTPGIREFGFFSLQAGELKEYFPKIMEYAGGCKMRDCSHIHEPKCTVKNDLESGLINHRLYQGYVSIHASLTKK